MSDDQKQVFVLLDIQEMSDSWRRALEVAGRLCAENKRHCRLFLMNPHPRKLLEERWNLQKIAREGGLLADSLEYESTFKFGGMASQRLGERQSAAAALGNQIRSEGSVVEEVWLFTGMLSLAAGAWHEELSLALGAERLNIVVMSGVTEEEARRYEREYSEPRRTLLKGTLRVWNSMELWRELLRQAKARGIEEGLVQGSGAMNKPRL